MFPVWTGRFFTTEPSGKPPHILEAGKSKIKVSADSVFSKPGSWLIDGALFAVSPHYGRVLELCGLSFI